MSKFVLTPRVCHSTIRILEDVVNKQVALDKAYSYQFQNMELTSQEHADITQVVGSIIRKLNLYLTILEITSDKLIENQASLFVVWSILNDLATPSHIQHTEQQVSDFKSRIDSLTTNVVLQDGCPDWLDTLGHEQLAEQWPAERAALSLPPKRYIRVNTLKGDQATLKNQLQAEGIIAIDVPNVANVLEITSNSSLFKSTAFQNGLFEQQDPGSVLILNALDVKPGHKVIDACAGAGGKSLGLASHMKRKGRLLAMDIEQHKLDTLKVRAKRASADNIETRLITSSKTIKRLKLSTDRLLLDVPCSGLGVLKRNPDAKWHRDMSVTLPDLLALQADILTRYTKMLKVGGEVVYATCSILPCENQDQIDKFLAENQNFELLASETISPANTGFDGFYWAKLRRITE